MNEHVAVVAALTFRVRGRSPSGAPPLGTRLALSSESFRLASVTPRHVSAAPTAAATFLTGVPHGS